MYKKRENGEEKTGEKTIARIYKTSADHFLPSETLQGIYEKLGRRKGSRRKEERVSKVYFGKSNIENRREKKEREGRKK